MREKYWLLPQLRIPPILVTEDLAPSIYMRPAGANIAMEGRS